MKDKVTAGILALLFGWFGVHRFYLGQTGRGILSVIFCWFPALWIIGIVDGIIFLTMNQEDFDYKYNSLGSLTPERRARLEQRMGGSTFQRTDRRGGFSQRQQQPAPRQVRIENPHKDTGLKKYKEYDFEGAIADYQKSLEIEPNDPVTHFNLACCYSLVEEVDKAFEHLNLAVKQGFAYKEKIKTHDALAYLRIQPQFDEFVANGYQIKTQTTTPPPQADPPKQLNLLNDEELIKKLKKLGELRDQGLITKEEFETQKQILFRDNS